MEASSVFDRIGRESGCRALATDFYSRVAGDSILRPLFPGKSLRCATEEFSAFLIQLFDGDEGQTQYRWWLSLRESHARFDISEAQRNAWLGHMRSALNEVVADTQAREALWEFFGMSSLYVVGQDAEPALTGDLAERWDRQLALDRLVEELVHGRDAEAIRLAEAQSHRTSVFVGILARMMELGRQPLNAFVLRQVQENPELAASRFNGRSLLHLAAGTGSLRVVRQLLAQGVDPDILDGGSHTPLYRAAGAYKGESGAAIVDELVRAGASVDHCGGVMRSTALHEAARHGNLPVARALLSHGANPEARDKKGLTPLGRAVNCRRPHVAALLAKRG
ncbi:MAG TPA: ankyrin repeat domain-containing protein [Fimbriimonadaceae bacterium]|nr:ankyrin repeat domain-containing protein [Fimbriimonadaceae bacterium]